MKLIKLKNTIKLKSLIISRCFHTKTSGIYTKYQNEFFVLTYKQS